MGPQWVPHHAVRRHSLGQHMLELSCENATVGTNAETLASLGIMGGTIQFLQETPRISQHCRIDGLKWGLNGSLIMPWDVILSDSCDYFFQFGFMDNLYPYVEHVYTDLFIVYADLFIVNKTSMPDRIDIYLYIQLVANVPSSTLSVFLKRRFSYFWISCPSLKPA